MQPISVSANGRYFVQHDGPPFFWLGDTAWELFRGFTPQDARALVQRRKEQGFSVLQIMLSGVDDGHTYFDISPERANPFLAARR